MILEILSNKNFKSLEKRSQIISYIDDGSCKFDEIADTIIKVKEASKSLILQAIEEISQRNEHELSREYILLAKDYLSSKSNSCKREAARIIGNLSPNHPIEAKTAIEDLLALSEDDGTVIRWSAAYALSRMLSVKEIADEKFINLVRKIAEEEQENGVKNQYIKALKKLDKAKK